MPTTAEIAATVRGLASRLMQTGVAPTPEASRVFAEIVSVALRYRGALADSVLAALGPDVDAVRDLCARGETLLENEWAESIAGATSPWVALSLFPYLENYERLVDLEHAAVTGVHGAMERIALIGAGALPLTGIQCAVRYEAQVILVDCDQTALERGTAVVKALGLDDRFAYAHADVGTCTLDLRAADLVVCAAMVTDMTGDKRACLVRLAEGMSPGAHIVVRSVAGLRELLYDRADVDDVPGLTPLLELHPRHDVVNSVLVARRT